MSETTAPVTADRFAEYVDRLGAVGVPAAVRPLAGGPVVANACDVDLFGRSGGPWPSDPLAPTDHGSAAEGCVYLPCALGRHGVTHLLRIVAAADRPADPSPDPRDGESPLDTLAAELSVEFVDDLLDTFLQELAPRVQAIEFGGPAESSRATDALKTVALLVGATGLATECARIERGAAVGPGLRRQATSAQRSAERWRSSRRGA